MSLCSCAIVLLGLQLTCTDFAQQWTYSLVLPPNQTLSAVATPGNTYTLSFDYSAVVATTQLSVLVDGVQILWVEPLVTSSWVQVSAQFVAKSASPALTFWATNRVLVDLVQLEVL